MNITDTNAVIALISDAIQDSLGPDWTSFDAAHHVMQWLVDAGLEIVPTQSAAQNVPVLMEACAGIDADYMTSEHHHPEYVLIPIAKFEAIRAAIAQAQEPTHER